MTEGALKATSADDASGSQGSLRTSHPRGNIPCQYCKKINHAAERCWWRVDVKCHKCKQLGHIQKVCKNNPQSATAAGAEEEAQEEVLLVATSMARELLGPEDLSKCILEKKDRKSETVWETYIRKRREKKKADKKGSKTSSEDESSDTDQELAEQPDDFFEESSEKGSKPAQGRNARKEKQNKEASQETEASRAELGLLLADDNAAPESDMKGYNLKRKKLKGKKDKEILDEGKLSIINYNDPRENLDKVPDEKTNKKKSKEEKEKGKEILSNGSVEKSKKKKKKKKKMKA